uniref:RGS domain-containing protein n=1 Tax=Laticauda laticaudata TaxID=8630 RepID=A0A8C5RGD9_LATLA
MDKICNASRSTTVSDGELNHSDLKDGASDTSLSSNASLPSVQSCQRQRDRRVASWAVSFERLLQDPLGIRYFSDFLRKEFSEENILFWQACDYFNHIPAHDKKELSFRAQEIFNKYLCSKATTPVNIDSQVQLADDVLTAPHPNMFKDQQLQIFNLMKFDSYARFLKSPFYQQCVLAEVEGRPVPDPQWVPNSPTLKSSFGPDMFNVSTPRKNGEQDPLDLGAPISSLDGQRVILEDKISKKGKDKGKGASLKHSAPVTTNAGSQALTGEGRPVGKHNSFKLKGEPGKSSREAHLAPKEARLAQTEKNTRQHLNLEEAEEFFELVSKVQSNRADDQRGLLRKEDLILPDFLQMPPCQAGISTSVPWEPAGPSSRTPHPDGQEESSPEDRSCPQPPSDSVAGQRGPEKAPGLPMALGQVAGEGPVPATSPRPLNLLLQGNPRWKEEVETMEEEDVIVADLSLVPKGDISSPPNRRLTLSETGSPTESKMASEKFRPGLLHKPRTHPRGSEGSLEDSTCPNSHRDVHPAGIRKEIGRPELPIHGVIDVDSVTTSQDQPWFCPEPESHVLLHGGVSELRASQPRRPTRTQRTSSFPAFPAAGSEKKEENEGPCKATFV